MLYLYADHLWLKFLIFDTLGFGLAGWIVMGVFGLIGFVVGTFKIPNLTIAPIFKVCAGGKPILCLHPSEKAKAADSKGGGGPDVYFAPHVFNGDA